MRTWTGSESHWKEKDRFFPRVSARGGWCWNGHKKRLPKEYRCNLILFEGKKKHSGHSVQGNDFNFQNILWQSFFSSKQFNHNPPNEGSLQFAEQRWHVCIKCKGAKVPLQNPRGSRLQISHCLDVLFICKQCPFCMSFLSCPRNDKTSLLSVGLK